MRRGFAILYALAALVLLGALISVVGLGVQQRMANLAAAQPEAQLRQLVVAGAQLSSAGVTGKVELPAELLPEAALSITAGDEPRVTAEFRGKSAECSIPRR